MSKVTINITGGTQQICSDDKVATQAGGTYHGKDNTCDTVIHINGGNVQIGSANCVQTQINYAEYGRTISISHSKPKEGKR